MKPAIVYRKARPVDVDGICDFHVMLLDHLRSVHPARYQKSSVDKRKFAKKLVGLMQDSKALVLCAYSENTLAGYAIGRIGQSPRFVLHNRFGEIDEVCVSPTFRKQGITRTLIAKLITWFKSKNIKRMELTVDAYNEVGLKAWTALKFEKHLLIMSRKI